MNHNKPITVTHSYYTYGNPCLVHGTTVIDGKKVSVAVRVTDCTQEQEYAWPFNGKTQTYQTTQEKVFVENVQ